MHGIADMGGTQGWGRVPPPRADEPVFAQPWQGRAFALALVSYRTAGANGTGHLTEEELVPLVTRDSMVGVAKVAAP